MAVSAHDVAAALRERLPGVGRKKLHKLLYYCQGHHLADLGEPLFTESLSAWDMGPVVGNLWKQEQLGEVPDQAAELGEAELNTVEYVVSRYGHYNGTDLELMTHAEPPWKAGDAVRQAMGKISARIEQDWIRDYFRDARPDEEEVRLDPAALEKFLAGAEQRRRHPARPDSLEELSARLGQG